MYYLLLTTYNLLFTTDYVLCTTYHLPLTTYYLLLFRYLQPSGDASPEELSDHRSFLSHISLKLTCRGYVKQEHIGHGPLHVLRRGLVMRRLRFLTAGRCWGEDMLLENADLIDYSQASSAGKCTPCLCALTAHGTPAYQRLPTSACLPALAYQRLPTSACLPAPAYQRLPTSACLPAPAYQRLPTSAAYSAGLPALAYQRLPTSACLPALAYQRLHHFLSWHLTTALTEPPLPPPGPSHHLPPPAACPLTPSAPSHHLQAAAVTYVEVFVLTRDALEAACRENPTSGERLRKSARRMMVQRLVIRYLRSSSGTEVKSFLSREQLSQELPVVDLSLESKARRLAPPNTYVPLIASHQRALTAHYLRVAT